MLVSPSVCDNVRWQYCKQEHHVMRALLNCNLQSIKYAPCTRSADYDALAPLLPYTSAVFTCVTERNRGCCCATSCCCATTICLQQRVHSTSPVCCGSTTPNTADASFTALLLH